MPMPPLQITGLVLHEEAIEIGYVRLPQDVRKNGLVWQHSVQIPRKSDYDDEIEAFEEALVALLEDALDDEDRAEAIDPTEEEEEDDDDDE